MKKRLYLSGGWREGEIDRKVTKTFQRKQNLANERDTERDRERQRERERETGRQTERERERRGDREVTIKGEG